MSYELDKNQNKSWKDITVICVAVLVSIAYRMGGSGNYARFFRPLGIGLGVTAVLWLLFGFHWSILVSGGLSAGLSTTYFPILNKWLGLPKDDKKWFNWFAVGLALSLALLPWAWATSHWLGFGIRSVVLTGLVLLWCQLIGNAVAEELGRGFLVIVTLFLLLI